MKIQQKELGGGEVDVLGLADGIDKANADVCCPPRFYILPFIYPLLSHAYPPKERERG